MASVPSSVALLRNGCVNTRRCGSWGHSPSSGGLDEGSRPYLLHILQSCFHSCLPTSFGFIFFLFDFTLRWIYQGAIYQPAAVKEAEAWASLPHRLSDEQRRQPAGGISFPKHLQTLVFRVSPRFPPWNSIPPKSWASAFWESGHVSLGRPRALGTCPLRLISLFFLVYNKGPQPPGSKTWWSEVELM